MAKLSDLVNININRDTIKIQGVAIPVMFTFKSFPHIEEVYGKTYAAYEKDLNDMMIDGKVILDKKAIKIMNCLIYAMIKSAGTDCTLYEIENSIPVSDLPAIFQTTLNIFNNQNFQDSDMEKIKSEKK